MLICPSTSKNPMVIINELKEDNPLYEYHIEIVNDRGGAVDVNALNRVIDQYSKAGWRLINIYSNEIGKDAISIGGIGINATADQNVLIFERKIIQKKETQEIELDVNMTNSGLPFRPFKFTIIHDDQSSSMKLRIYSIEDNVNAILADVQLHTIFDEIIVEKDVEFLNFTQKSAVTYESDITVRAITPNVYRILESCRIDVKAYITTEGVIKPKDHELITIEQIHEQNNEKSGLNLENLWMEIQDFKSAADIVEYIRAVNDGTISESVFQRLDGAVKIERMYGKMPGAAKKIIEECLSAK